MIMPSAIFSYVFGSTFTQIPVATVMSTVVNLFSSVVAPVIRLPSALMSKSASAKDELSSP